MDKAYYIFLDDKLIGKTIFEHADAPMGVVFGKIDFIDVLNPYDFIRSYCKDNNIGVDDFPDDKVISTRTIPQLKVMNEQGREVKGIGNQISGMDFESFELTIEGIPYPFFGEEFPRHVEDDEKRFTHQKVFF